MGREMGRRFKRRWSIYLWLTHVEAWQEATKFCKAVILQLKNKLIKKKGPRPSAASFTARAQTQVSLTPDPPLTSCQITEDPGWSDSPLRRLQTGCPPGGKGRNRQCQCLARVFERLHNHPESIVPILQKMKESLQKSKAICPKSCSSHTAELGFKLSSPLCLLLWF